MMKGIPDDFLLGSAPKFGKSSGADAKGTGKSNSGAKATSDDSQGAPIELMSKFLLLITENKMAEALDLSKEILHHEPKNKIVLEYQIYLKEYIAQGLDKLPPTVSYEEEEKDSEDADYGDDNQGDDDDDEEGDDDEDDSDKENDEDNEDTEDEEQDEAKNHK